MKKNLKNKNILITAGPTWVPIDKVRVITNIFGGNLGALIAEYASWLGAKTTLLLGPSRVELPKSTKNFKIVRYKYFDDLLNLLKREVASKKYDVVIHSAAVSDYAPISAKKGKIKSGKRNLIIKFKPTLKIVDNIKKWDPDVFLIKFKLEVGLKEKELIATAYKSMISSNADIIVANDFEKMDRQHIAFIIDKKMNVIKCRGKNKIAKKILYTILNLI